MLANRSVEAAMVLFDLRDRIGTITFNNPSKRNALSASLLGEMVNVLDVFEKANVPVVILRAPKGSKVWSAGHDIKELPRSGRDPLGYNDPLETALRAIQRYPGVVVAMVEGGVWGGATDLVLTCDIVIGDPTCTFAITPVKIGLPYNVSGVLHFINRLGPSHAKEMFFTARPIDAHLAEQWGILNHLVPTDELEAFTHSLAEGIAVNSSLSIAAIKEQFRILAGAHPINPETFERIQGLRRQVYDSQDYTEGIQAFLEKRRPIFQGK